ncbi:hypothetical protein SLA_5552 [Streptomyces laurentii]|uniref:Uncharacterized protein n=1 Tax=Streptomyces laurentii TaxID=39478 RepID=A0A160P5Y8_STRLU|nr:hypothetical protein SLA_5552 [Streptomyces laurentii]
MDPHTTYTMPSATQTAAGIRRPDPGAGGDEGSAGRPEPVEEEGDGERDGEGEAAAGVEADAEAAGSAAGLVMPRRVSSEMPPDQ